MKKLLIMALSLALLTPSSILASEQEIEEFIPEEMELLEINDIEEDPQCHLEFKFHDEKNNTTEVVTASLSKRDILGDKSSASLKDHIFDFIPININNYGYILDRFDFVNDLPIVDESNFGSKAEPIVIEVTLRGASDLTSIDTAKPFYMYGEIYEEDFHQGEFLTYSKGEEVLQNVTGNQITIDKNVVEKQIMPNWRLKSNVFNISQIFPIKANGKIIAYGLTGVEFRSGTYDEIKNLMVYVDIYDPALQKDREDFSTILTNTFEVPLRILCPEEPVGNKFTIDSSVSKRLADYINNEGWEFSHLRDPKDEGYIFSFDISSQSSREYPLTNLRFELPGEIKVKFSNTSLINLRLYLKEKPEIDVNSTGSSLLSVEELCGSDKVLDQQELQDWINILYNPLSLKVADNFEPIDFNQLQVWDRKEPFFSDFILPVTVNSLEDKVRNNTDFEVRFWDYNFWTPIDTVCKKWEDWFPNPASVSDFIPYENIIRTSLPKGFEVDDFNLSDDLTLYNFYGILVVPVRPISGYPLDHASMWDWGSDDEQGNPQFSLTYKDRYLGEGEDYTVAYTRNGDKITATCTGIGSFSGAIKFEFLNQPSYNIRFYDQQANGFLNKEVSLKEGAMTASLSDYLREIPEGYHYVNKPKNLNIDDFNYSENRNQRIAGVEIAPTPYGDFQWNFTNQDIKIFVPYKIDGDLAGTLTFGISDIKDNKISKETITKRLIGYEATQDLILDKASTSVIGYKSGNSFFALEYNFNPIEVQQKDLSTPSSGETVSVSIGSGTVEIPLDEFKEDDSFTTKNLSQLLQKVLKEIAQKVIDSVDSILPSPSEPSQTFLPGYDLEVKSVSLDLTSKDLDLAGSEQGKIEVKVNSNSHILLNFIPTRRKEIAIYEVMQDEEMIETASVIRELSLETNSTEEKEIAIVKLEDIASDQKLTPEAIENYLQTQEGINKEFNADFKEYFTSVDFSKPQDLSMINPETGYIEIDIPVVAAETTDVPNDSGNSKPNNSTGNSPVVSSPVKPTQSTPEQPSVPTEEPSTPVTKPENPVEDDSSSNNGNSGSSSNKPSSNKPSGGGSSSSNKPTTTPKPEEPTQPVGTPTTMYRLYNRLTGEHLYTTDKAEKDHLLISDTWQDEGQGWIAPSESEYPVYRLLNPNNGDHHYTMDKNEFDTLQTLGWEGEGIAFFSADTESSDHVILHRVYNPNEKGAGSHHYTVDEAEKEALVKLGWQYEGTAWAGLKSE